ncbi:MAG: hypothetical protein IKN05_07275 [Clostridia bacterium]|nr:hypothetical protein [Clostridia bacterium]
MPVVALLDKALKHMTLRRGVAGDETVGRVGSDAELRPYKTEKGATDKSRIIARTLTTYLGDVIEEFDPYQLFTTVYGEQFSDKTKRTEAEIVQALCLQMGKSVAKKLGAALFNAQRNPAGTTTATLFNGFNTIAAAEITAGNIAAAKGNYIEVDTITAANVGDVLKAIYDGASEELQEADNLKMFLPKSIKKLYDDWCLAHFGAVVYNTTYVKNRLHGTDENPCELVALSGMKNSPYIYLSTKENMLVGCDQSGNPKEKFLVRVPDNPKVVQFFACMFWGVQFEQIEQEFLLVAKQVTPTPITVSGDDSVALGSGTTAAVRTYATSNGSAVTAQVTTEGASWLSVSASGNKVTFTPTAFAYDAAGTSPRTATVRVSAATGSGYIDVTVSQEMAANQ